MKKGLKVVFAVGIAAAVLAAGYLAGYKSASHQMENTSQTMDQQTFYAQVEEINGDRFLVEGLPVNNINYRGAFDFSATEKTKLLWRGTKMELSDFDVGDTVSITFEGEILETYPGQISKVVKIELLDDEK